MSRKAAVSEIRNTRSAAGIAAWARRPNDRVFDSILGLTDFARSIKEVSREEVVATEHLTIITNGDSTEIGKDPLYLNHPQSGLCLLNNHSFNQVCQSVGARAGEYRKLPAAIAQIPLTWLAENSDRKDRKLLISRNEEGAQECRSVTSPAYGRIWNYELSTAIEKHIDPDVWTVPNKTAFHEKTGFITTSDRKCFVFMVDEKHPISVPGHDKPAYRGFYAWNSETGDGSAGIAEFMFFEACANRSIMGMSEFEELYIRHTAGAPDRWLNEAAPKLKKYCNSSPRKVQALLETSREKKVAKDEKGALSWLQKRGFTKSLSQTSLEFARSGEGGADVNASPFSAFNLMMGITAAARDKVNNDERVDLERKAGAIMRMVD